MNMGRRFGWPRVAVMLGAVAVIALAGAGVAAQNDEGEFGIQLGALVPDDKITGDSSDAEPAFGLRGGYRFSRHWGWFIDGLYSDIGTLGADVEAVSGRTGFEVFLGDTGKRTWFLGFGGGYLRLDDEITPEVDGPFGSLGFGQRFRVGGRTMIRWELRGDRTLDDERFGGEDLTQGLALLGVTWGGGRPTDADGDGVLDGRDKCPDTPRGATVDERGCPTDSDGDGVLDGLDRCPDTPRGWPVDGKGCPTDRDGDGVADGEDACPDTPRGATVDARGCPKDADGDGVLDGLDACPDTPRGATVDARGCSKDADGDGVFDGIDRCPDTPRGAMVDASGCPRDGDRDGVPDGLDRCPDTPAGATVDKNGCTVKLFEPGRESLVLEGVNFETNSAVLTASSTATLDRVAASLKNWPEVRVEIGGHTDSSGSDAYNLKLSTARAEAVRNYLVLKGAAAGQLVARGYGETRPIADNATAAGRAKNRRVELRQIK